MFKIGLDLSIYAKIKDKRTGQIYPVELAYWRKAYGIRRMLVTVAEHFKINHPDNYEDVQIHCNTFALDTIITNFLSALPDYDSDYWTDSIWTQTETRDITLDQLKTLLLFKSWLNGDVDTSVVFTRLDWSDGMPPIEDVSNYDICLEILNSY